MECLIEDCSNTVWCKGLCRSHYNKSRYKPTGKPYLRTIEERFEYYTDRSGECWIWTGGTRRGYGAIHVSGEKRQRLAHRVSYEREYGVELSSSDVIHHRCHRPACVRPDHLELVTHHLNVSESLDRKQLLARIAELEAMIELSKGV